MFYKTVKPLFSKVLMMSLLTFPGRVMRKLRVSRETKLDINFLIFSLKYFQPKLDLVSPLTSFLPLYTFYLISEYGNWNKYCFVPQNLLILNNNTRWYRERGRNHWGSSVRVVYCGVFDNFILIIHDTEKYKKSDSCTNNQNLDKNPIVVFSTNKSF